MTAGADILEFAVGVSMAVCVYKGRVFVLTMNFLVLHVRTTKDKVTMECSLKV